MQYQIPLPTNSMSWNDILLLTGRFPVDGSEQTRIYGFMNSAYSVNLFEYAVLIGGNSKRLPNGVTPPGTLSAMSMETTSLTCMRETRHSDI